MSDDNKMFTTSTADVLTQNRKNSPSNTLIKDNAAVIVIVVLVLLLILVTVLFCWYHSKHKLQQGKETQTKDIQTLTHTIPNSATATPQKHPKYTMSEMILRANNENTQMLHVIEDGASTTSVIVSETAPSPKGVHRYRDPLSLTSTVQGNHVGTLGRKVTEQEDTISLMQQAARQHYAYDESQTKAAEDSVVMQTNQTYKLGGALQNKITEPEYMMHRKITDMDESMTNESYPSKTEFTHDSETYYKGYKQNRFPKSNFSVQQSQLIEQDEDEIETR
eukprot:190427_1